MSRYWRVLHFSGAATGPVKRDRNCQFRRATWMQGALPQSQQIHREAFRSGVVSTSSRGECSPVKEFILSYQVYQEDEFLQLSAMQLVNLIRRDELNVQQEKDVYNAVLKWVRTTILATLISVRRVAY